MTTNNILLDKNIAIDIITRRERKPKILEILKDYDQCFITTHTFATCFYILRKHKLSKEEIYSHLTDFKLLEIHPNDCHLAFSIAQNLDDIEDCLELCSAKRKGFRMITADQQMLLKYNNFFEMILV